MKLNLNTLVTLNTYTEGVINKPSLAVKKAFAVPSNVTEKAPYISQFEYTFYKVELNHWERANIKDKGDDAEKTARIEEAIAFYKAIVSTCENKGLENGTLERITDSEKSPIHISNAVKATVYAVNPHAWRSPAGVTCYPSDDIAIKVLRTFANIAKKHDDNITLSDSEKKELRNIVCEYGNSLFRVENGNDFGIFKNFACKVTLEDIDRLFATYQGTVYRFKDSGISIKGMKKQRFIAQTILAILYRTFKFSEIVNVIKSDSTEFTI